MEFVLVKEIFFSIQGETSHCGLPYIFVRLSGCNLRCSYCDTAYAFKGGDRLTFLEVLERIEGYKTHNILITGGEPLLQRGTLGLVLFLKEKGFTVSIETHGEHPIEKFSPHARLVMDIKTPGSGMCRGGYANNLPFLKSEDEIKFVITSEEDFHWARTILSQNKFQTQHILFSPVVPQMNPRWLAEQILDHRLPVRMQVQLHKIIWGNHATGV